MTLGSNMNTVFDNAIDQLGTDCTHKRWNSAGTLASTVGTKTVMIGMMSKEDEMSDFGGEMGTADAKIYTKPTDDILVRDILDADSTTRYILLKRSMKHFLTGDEICRVFFAKKELYP
jgi:hypothetical protein